MADAPYTPFPSIQPSADALPSQQIPADEETFGAGVGTSLRRTGAIMRRAADETFALELRFAEMENETRALDAATEFTRRSNEITGKFRQLNGQQAVDALPGTERALVDLDREIGKSLKAPGAQRAYKARAGNILTSSMQVTGLHAADQAAAASDAAKVGAISAAQSRFANHFGIAPTKPDIDEIVSLSAALAFERGLPKEAADVLIQKNVGDALANVMGVKIFQGRSAEARAIFEEASLQKVPGTDIPLFSGERMAELGAVVKRAEEAEALDKIQAEQRAHAAAEGERRQIQDDFLKKMRAGTLTATEVLASKLDPFGLGSKDQFLDMLKVGATGGEMKTNNELYIQLFDRIHMPDGFPGKITDENELNQYLGRGLNPVSIMQLRGEITGKRTQEGSVEGELKRNFTEMAKRRISGSNPLLGIADPAGDAKYFQFLQYFLGAYDKAVRAGGSPSELLDPNGVFYKSIDQYIRSPQEWTRDLQMGATGTVAPATPSSPAITGPSGRSVTIPPSPPPRTATAFPAGMLTPDEKTQSPFDTAKYPPVMNADGSFSNVLTIIRGFGEDGREVQVLLPTMIDGRKLTDQQAVQHYLDTGENFGKFESVEAAKKFDADVHRDLGAKVLPKKGQVIPGVKFSPSQKLYWWKQGDEWKSSSTPPRVQ